MPRRATPVRAERRVSAGITAEMRRVVAEQRLGFVATISPDGAPNLSPKGTVRALDDEHLVFVDLRSPQTVRNIERDPRVEVNVVDPLTRRGYRFAGRGSVHRSGAVFDRAVALYRGEGSTTDVRTIVAIYVERALPITSPVYDTGASEREVRARWRRHWLELWDGWDDAMDVHGTAARDGSGPPSPPSNPPVDASGAWRRGDYAISADVERLDLDVVYGYLTRSYWSPGIPRATVERAVRNSLAFGIYHAPIVGGGTGRWQQVGFARVITDRATFAYLADVFVLEGHRDRGLATWLMEIVTAHRDLQGLRRWTLATRDAHGLYAKFGFTLLPSPGMWMERSRREPYGSQACDAPGTSDPRAGGQAP